MKKLLLLLALLLPSIAAAFPATQLSRQSVASGGQIQTTVSAGTELQIIVDNTAGTAMRQLTLEACADNTCATVIDTVPLRMVAFGTAPTGSVYAPGAVRGYVGPNPPGGTSGRHLLLSQQSADNTTNNIAGPPIRFEEFESLIVTGLVTGAGTTQIGQRYFASDSTTQVAQGAPSTAAAGAIAVFSPSLPPSSGAGVLQSPWTGAGLVPYLTAPGAGSTTRLEIWGIGRVPGTFSVQMMIPQWARITLAAGGSGAATMTILGK